MLVIQSNLFALVPWVNYEWLANKTTAFLSQSSNLRSTNAFYIPASKLDGFVEGWRLVFAHFWWTFTKLSTYALQCISYLSDGDIFVSCKHFRWLRWPWQRNFEAHDTIHFFLDIIKNIVNNWSKLVKAHRLHTNYENDTTLGDVQQRWRRHFRYSTVYFTFLSVASETVYWKSSWLSEFHSIPSLLDLVCQES